MNPGAYDLTIFCGTTLDADAMRFTFKVGGQPVDLSTMQARAQARLVVGGSETVLFDLTTENGGIVLGGTAGTIALIMPAEATSALWRPRLTPVSTVSGREVYQAGNWDLELVAADGRVTRLLHGRLMLSPEMTR